MNLGSWDYRPYHTWPPGTLNFRILVKEMAEVSLNCFLFISVFGIIAEVKSSGLQVIKDAVGDQNGL